MKLVPKVKEVNIRNSSPLRKTNVVAEKEITHFDASIYEAVYLHHLMLKELQRAKADIVLSCLDFNLFDAFRLIDIRGQGNITQQDLLNSF
jgi:hypothetical protein